jgi:hypothetical protein
MWGDSTQNISACPNSAVLVCEILRVGVGFRPSVLLFEYSKSRAPYCRKLLWLAGLEFGAFQLRTMNDTAEESTTAPLWRTPLSWIQLASGKWPIPLLKSSWNYGDMALWDGQFLTSANRNDLPRLCSTSRSPHVSTRPRGLCVYWSEHTFVRHWNSRTNKFPEYFCSSLTNMRQTLLNYLQWGMRFKQKELNVSSYSDVRV